MASFTGKTMPIKDVKIHYLSDFPSKGSPITKDVYIDGLPLPSSIFSSILYKKNEQLLEESTNGVEFFKNLRPKLIETPISVIIVGGGWLH
ncbi:hypothetical protein QE152_g10366 [Popillia japonica]|uniref:Uncharacterized protein n=1 Tax=Popillia japonica TaxID=7064 RepID=A0AAW1LUY6_POPJA